MKDDLNSLTCINSVIANKQGTISQDQRNNLRLISVFTFWSALGSAVVIIVIVLWAINKQTESLPANSIHIPAYFWIVLTCAIGAPLLYLGWKFVRSSRIRQELNSGKITSEEGRIEWTGMRYRIIASVKGLRSIYGPINVMPGRYQFFLLPGSRYLLSANPLDTPQMYLESLTDILGLVFGFTDDDIAANRSGRITPVQAARLRYYERNDKITFVQGPLVKNFSYLTHAVIRSCLVGHELFYLNTRSYNALLEGETYRIYYTQKTKKILSVEVIPSNYVSPSS